MKTFSLTKRLVTAVLFVEVCSTLVLVTSAGIYEGISQFRAFDVMLRGRADSMLGAVQDSEDPQDNVMLDGTQYAAPKQDIYAVRDELGRMLGNSQNWEKAESEFRDEREFRLLTVHGQAYRVIRVAGLRMVDPGDKGGGIPRHVVVLYGTRTHRVWRSVGKAVVFYAALSLLLLVASGVLMLRFLRRGLQPLHELAAQATQVSVHSWRFQPSTQAREVRELAPLAAALEAAIAGLERSFEQQRQFVSDAAHELKTSVSVIKSSLQVLRLRDRTAAEYRAGVERAELDCERMEDLVARMLTLAGLEAGVAEERKHDLVELSDMVYEVIEHLRTAAELVEVRLVVVTAGPAWVAGDREKLRLLCSNLMHNALQHSKTGGEVRALIGSAVGLAELRIEDDGEGIAPAILEHVFERFYRGDGSRSRKTGGTGLGLAISKAIVQGMKGRIRIESEVGRGTRVMVELPGIIDVKNSVGGEEIQPSSGFLKVELP